MDLPSSLRPRRRPWRGVLELGAFACCWWIRYPHPSLLVELTSGTIATASAGPSGQCAYEDSIFVTANVAPIDLGSTRSCAKGKRQRWTVGWMPRLEDLLWSTGDTVSSIVADTTGVYWVTAVNPEGCERSDTVSISIFDNPVIVLDADGAACEGQPCHADGHGDQRYHCSRCGLVQRRSGQLHRGHRPGDYEAISVDVTGCTGTASISPAFYPSPVPSGAADTVFVLEEDGPIWLDVTQPDVAYSWSDGSYWAWVLLSS